MHPGGNIPNSDYRSKIPVKTADIVPKHIRAGWIKILRAQISSKHAPRDVNIFCRTGTKKKVEDIYFLISFAYKIQAVIKRQQAPATRN